MSIKSGLFAGCVEIYAPSSKQSSCFFSIIDHIRNRYCIFGCRLRRGSSNTSKVWVLQPAEFQSPTRRKCPPRALLSSIGIKPKPTLWWKYGSKVQTPMPPTASFLRRLWRSRRLYLNPLRIMNLISGLLILFVPRRALWRLLPRRWSSSWKRKKA